MSEGNWKRALFALVLIALLALGGVVQALDLGDATYVEEWDGLRGLDSERCEYVGQEGRPETGWIHWIFATKGDSDDARLVLGGTGSGTFEPGEPLNAETWHFYTPFFELDGLEATIYLFGGDPGPGGGLVISDYCPGLQEELTVEKTAVTSFEREHFWDIDKSVETEEGHELDDVAKIWLYIDGSGDEKATWTIDVTYEGYVDSEFNVSGVITVTNTGQLDAVITSIEDLLAGEAIDIDCGEIEFPFTLAVGETLVCAYSEDVESKIEGYNVVTVTTERDTYTAKAAIIWGDPTTEINKTVNVKDISDLFGEVALGTVTAPYGDTFTYYKNLAFEDFEDCGAFLYENRAMIVETNQYADAELKVNVQCVIFESAWAQGPDGECFSDFGFSNWGWTNPVTPSTNEYWPLWAGAAQCDTDKGTLVGNVHVMYDGTDVIVHFNIDPEYTLGETHVYAGYEMFPRTRRGDFTVAPGQYSNEGPFEGGQVWVIAHATVGLPDPDFGP